MTFSKHPIPSSWCWKLASIIPISKKYRWHIGRQYHSDFGAYNHPFWVHLQRRWCFLWWDIEELYEGFYPEDGDTYDSFIQRVANQLKDVKI